MAQTLLILASLLLVLTLSFEIQPVEGRHLRSKTKSDTKKLQSPFTVPGKDIKHTAGKTINKTVYGNQDTASTIIIQTPPSQASGNTRAPPPPDHVADFRPTSPGHSPGVGHSIHT
ncbi:Precursor of CEP [Heracleum sosnowskyi]|uniref:Precursor of CEP n=1 Tax=Heracleum sosnowskyi TaxID=360622 RepID=A0AAD8M6C9_9APIA|nr:Precursor of CEP [Heracleum sosnowskyi]